MKQNENGKCLCTFSFKQIKYLGSVNGVKFPAAPRPLLSKMKLFVKTFPVQISLQTTHTIFIYSRGWTKELIQGWRFLETNQEDGTWVALDLCMLLYKPPLYISISFPTENNLIKLWSLNLKKSTDSLPLFSYFCLLLPPLWSKYIKIREVVKMKFDIIAFSP